MNNRNSSEKWKRSKRIALWVKSNMAATVAGECGFNLLIYYLFYHAKRNHGTYRYCRMVSSVIRFTTPPSTEYIFSQLAVNIYILIDGLTYNTVSYTHLTLPTKLEV